MSCGGSATLPPSCSSRPPTMPEAPHPSQRGRHILRPDSGAGVSAILAMDTESTRFLDAHMKARAAAVAVAILVAWSSPAGTDPVVRPDDPHAEALRLRVD